MSVYVWFLVTQLSDFASLSWEQDNPYYRNEYIDAGSINISVAQIYFPEFNIFLRNLLNFGETQ